MGPTSFRITKYLAMAEIHDQFDTILILDFGSQVCHHERKNNTFLMFSNSSTAISSPEDVESSAYTRNWCLVQRRSKTWNSCLRVLFFSCGFKSFLTQYILVRNYLLWIPLLRVWRRCTTCRSCHIRPWSPGSRDLLWFTSMFLALFHSVDETRTCHRRKWRGISKAKLHIVTTGNTDSQILR
jgi:hypothetical protein